MSGIWVRETTKFIADLTKDYNVTGAVMTPWAQGVQEQRQKRNHVDDPLGYCLPSAPPRLNATVPLKIIPTPTLTAILYETASGSTFRQVFPDGRKLPQRDTEPTFLGYSVGRWDGTTFVVETSGFRDLGWLDLNGHPHSDALFVTERFRRINVGRMELTMTIDDPKAYVKPWQIAVPLRLAPDSELLENYCESHTKTMEHRRIDPAPPEPPVRVEIKVRADAEAPFVPMVSISGLTGDIWTPPGCQQGLHDRRIDQDRMQSYIGDAPLTVEN